MSGQPQVNGSMEGGKYIDSIDPDDPEYVRQMQRPAEVKEDVQQMEQRQRVSLILHSKAFREELEQIVNEQISKGGHPASLMALQQLADFFVPTYKMNQSAFHAKGGGIIIPINDMRGTESLNYSKGEKSVRCKLAATYRLMEMFGWSQGIYNHITARISQEHEHFLINPLGMLYHEVTASSLVKVDMQGNVLDQGSTSLGINRAGYTLHSAIHQARPDIKCVIHLRTPAAQAVSIMKCGLLPISQDALICGEISYYDYSGILIDQGEKDKLARTLGPSNKVMFLRNHGVVACGNSIEEAFHYATNIMSACETQMRVMPAGVENLIEVPEDVRKRTFEVASHGGQGVDSEGDKKKWRPGEIEFEAYMRFLDACGYRTGYLYRDLQRRGGKGPERSNSEVEIPPTSSSYNYMYDENERSKYQSPLQFMLEKQKKQVKSEWLNTPNTYRKEEFEETGTPNPKKITKWVAEGEGTKHGSSVRIETSNQFAPQGADPKELKNKHKEIRKEYYEDKIDAGPQSKVLEGMTWEEAQKIKDGHVSGTSDSVIVVGAASKGIIQRDHQHNAVVYKQYYAANPFDNMNPEEIEAYKKEIEKKAKGEAEPGEEDLVPGPDGRLISTEERNELIRQGQQEVTVTTRTRRYVETSIDDLVASQRPPPFQSTPHPNSAYVKPGVKETSIDDVLDTPELQQPPPPGRAPRTPTTPTTPSGHVQYGVPVLPAAIVAQQRQPPVSPQAQQGVAYQYSSPQQPAQGYSQPGQGHSQPASPTTPTGTQDFGRSASARYPPQQRPASQPVNGGEPAGSPTKSTSSGEGTLEEGSPSKEAKSDKKKKKKFRMPSFSSKKKDKKAEAAQ